MLSCQRLAQGRIQCIIMLCKFISAGPLHDAHRVIVKPFLNPKPSHAVAPSLSKTAEKTIDYRSRQNCHGRGGCSAKDPNAECRRNRCTSRHNCQAACQRVALSNRETPSSGTLSGSRPPGIDSGQRFSQRSFFHRRQSKLTPQSVHQAAARSAQRMSACCSQLDSPAMRRDSGIMIATAKPNAAATNTGFIACSSDSNSPSCGSVPAAKLHCGQAPAG